MSQDEDKDKRVAFYAACVESWFATRMELDKSLLTLSAGGVGILVGFMSDAGLRSIESLILYIFSLISFLICIAAVLYVLKANSGYLEKINQEYEDVQSGSKLLSAIDTIAVISFGVGVLFASIIGTSLAVRSFYESETVMSKIRNDPTTLSGGKKSSTNELRNSYNKAESMKPKTRPVNQEGGSKKPADESKSIKSE